MKRAYLTTVRALTGAGAVRDFANSVILRVISAIILFATGILLARRLGPEQFGAYSIAIAWATIISVPVTSGLPSFVLRQVASMGHGASISSLAEVSRFSAKWILVTMSAAALFAYLGFTWITGLVGVTAAVVVFQVLAIGANGLDRFAASSLQGAGKPLQAQVIQDVLRPTLFLLGIAAVNYTVGPDVDVLLFTYIGTLVMAGVIALWYQSRYIRLGFHLRTNSSSRWAWIATVATLSVFSAAQTLVGNGDVLLISLLGTAEDVGIYRVALQGLVVLNIAQTGISGVLVSRMARAYQAHDLREVKRVSDLGVLFFVPITLGIVLVFFLFGRQAIYLLFGAAFADAFPILLLLSIGQLTNALTGPGLALLIAGCKERAAIFSVLLAGLTLAVLGFALGTQWGLVGIAVASSLGASVFSFATVYYVRRHFGFSPTFFAALSRNVRMTRKVTG